MSGGRGPAGRAGVAAVRFCSAAALVFFAIFAGEAAASSVTTGSLVFKFFQRWRGPNLPMPVPPDTPRWETIGRVEGYRLQRNRILGYYRVLDPANVRLGWGSRDYCEDLLARQLENPSEVRRRFNIEVPTLGGLQFWGDEMVYCGWRIQRSALDGHCRLLDPRDIRRAWGTYEECERAFRSLVDTSKVRPQSDEFVILLHGLFRSRRSFRGLEKYLKSHGFEVVAVKYPSTRTSIEEQAAQLARVIGHLQGARKIHFVTHSLGGLIVRCYLRDHHDPRIGRVVMIAPPNHGALMARMLVDWVPFRILVGPVGKELIGGSDSVIASLPPPWCDFAVIAGGKGNDKGYSPLIPGDDDGIVAVEETKLEGMKEFMLVPAIHAFIMNNERVKRAVVSFLRTGSFGQGAPQEPATKKAAGSKGRAGKSP